MTEHVFVDLALKKHKLRRYPNKYKVYTDEKNSVDINAGSAKQALELSKISAPFKVVSLGYASLDDILDKEEVEVISEPASNVNNPAPVSVSVTAPTATSAPDSSPISEPQPTPPTPEDVK